MNSGKINVIFGLLRIGIGWIFLWAFLDKVFGLGYATEAGKGWLDGSSPTVGFLKFGTKGPFAEIFQGLAGLVVIDYLFMVGLLLMGIALMLGIGVRIASTSGIIMLILMYLAMMLPEHNPILDEHIIYSIVLLGIMFANAGDYIGFGRAWSSTVLVQRHPWLR